MKNLRTLSRRTGALLLAGVTLLSSTALAVGDGVTPTYDEAYYGTLDYYGNLTEGSVVKSYIMNGCASLTDYGDYDSISNLTNAAQPVTAGEKTTFDFGADSPSHFYFEGKTAKPFETLPWTLTVKYLLNGVPTKAEDLAGKTGMVEINVDAVPNKAVSDYVRHNYTLMATTLFNQDHILSLEAPGAQVQLLGNLRSVIFLALPGEETHFVIRVGAEDFEFAGLTFLMVPATLSQVEDISRLAQRKEDLEDYYRRLSGSLDDVVDSLDGLGNNLRSAASGLDALNSARGTVSAGKDSIYEKAETLRGDLDALNAALAPVNGDLETTSAALTDTKAVLKGATTDVTDLRGQLDDLKSVLTKLQKSNGDLTDALKDMTELEDKIKKVQESKKDLNSVIGDLAAMEEDFDRMHKDLNTMSATGTGVKPLRLFDGAMSKAQLQQALTQEKALDNCFRGANGGSALTDVSQFMDAVLSYKGASVTSTTLTQIYNGVNGAMETDHLSLSDALKAVTQQSVLVAAPELGAPAAAKQLEATVSSKLPETQTAYETAAGLTQAFEAAGGSPMDYQHFLYAALLASGMNPATAQENAEKLYTLYQLGDEAELLVSQYDTIKGTVGNINSTINQVNRLAEDMAEPTADVAETLSSVAKDVDQLSKLVNSTDELLTQAAAMSASAGDLQNLVDSADDLAGLGKETADQLTLTLNDLDTLYGVLDTYEPKAQEALVTAEALIDTATRAMTDTTSFTSALEELMKASGNQLDAGTQQALSSLSGTLRKTATSFDATDSVRSAKDSITDIIEDIWDEYTGDVADVLEMDATAPIQSLTSARNPSPQSVQVVLRTQEIKVEDGKDADAAASTTVKAEKASFLSKLADMFKGVWKAITGLFHK